MSVALWMMCMSNLVDINDAEKPSAHFLSGGANSAPWDFLFLPHREGFTCNTKRSRRSKTHTRVVCSHLHSFPLSDHHDMTFIWALQNRSGHSALHVSNSRFAAGNGCLKNSNLSSQKPCEVKRSRHDQDYHLESVCRGFNWRGWDCSDRAFMLLASAQLGTCFDEFQLVIKPKLTGRAVAELQARGRVYLTVM